MSDAELVGAARAGDAGAMGALVARHRAGMHAAAIRVLGPGPEAEDAVQDALIVALTKIGDLESPEAVGSWLRSIARHRALHVVRGLRETPVDDVEALTALEASGEDPQHAVEALALGDWLWRALDRLSDPLRLTMVLRHFSAAHQYVEIAALLGVPVGTVRSRLSEARRQLLGELVAVADRADGDQLTLARSRRRLIEDVYAGYNRGDPTPFLDMLADDVTVHAGGSCERGKDLAAAGLAADLTAEMRFSVLEVIAGRDLTVVDGRFQNPADDPDHCPEWTTQVLLHRDEQVASMRLHFRLEV